MSLFQEFKKFAMKGNVIDMAVGIIIGAAFGKITTSLVNGIIMPPIGVIIGNVDFTQLSWVIQEATADQPAVMINYGDFLQTLINFIIIAFSVFMLVKFMNKLKKKEEAAPAKPAAPSKEEVLLAEIRDLLASQNQQPKPDTNKVPETHL